MQDQHGSSGTDSSHKHTNRVAQFMDDREFTPEECQKICEDAITAADKHFDEAKIPDDMKKLVKAGFTSIMGEMMAGLKIGATIRGHKLKEVAEAGSVLAGALDSFWSKYHEGVQTCQANGGSPACETAGAGK